MNIKDLADKLASLDKLEKLSTQVDKKIPGQQPSQTDPKSDVLAMQQALSALRMNPQTSQAIPAQPVQATDKPINNQPPEQKDLQQKNKPGEPIGEAPATDADQEKQKRLQSAVRYFNADPSRLKSDPRFLNLKPEQKVEILKNLNPTAQQWARLQTQIDRAKDPTEKSNLEQQQLKVWSAHFAEKDAKPAAPTNDPTAATKPAAPTNDPTAATKPAAPTDAKPAAPTDAKPAAPTDAKPAAPKGKFWDTVSNVAKNNNIKNPNLIYPNQEIVLPSGEKYVVKPGDTLSQIVKRDLNKQTSSPQNATDNPPTVTPPPPTGDATKNNVDPNNNSATTNQNSKNRDFVYDPQGELVPGDSSQAADIRNTTTTSAPTAIDRQSQIADLVRRGETVPDSLRNPEVKPQPSPTTKVKEFSLKDVVDQLLN